MLTEDKLRNMILQVFETTECKKCKYSTPESRIDLIKFCQKLSPIRPEGYYGDINTGFISTQEAIRIRDLLYSCS